MQGASQPLNSPARAQARRLAESGPAALALALCLGACAAACSSGDLAVAQHNRVFYAWETIGARSTATHETPYPPLDFHPESGAVEYKGVEVLEGAVRLSRPVNWVIRAASHAPGGRYIQYVSPNEYIFSVYERNELPDALWTDVLARYEKDLKAAKAEVVHSAVPLAMWNAQARAYLVRRKVAANRGPFVNLSREYVARADRRVVLVQVVHPTTGLGPLSDELARVVQTLQLP